MSVQHVMWTEKYRPTSLDDVVGHDTAVERFRRFLDDDTGGLPHTILFGPPGTGKTAVAMGWAHDHYGESVSENVREFNASDERGIDVIRDKIKNWCRSAPAAGYSYKVVFLDEADQLTADAQNALRRIMEQYSDTTRFILTANYINQISDPLQSRCSPFHFSAVEDAEVRKALLNVIDGEDITVEEDALDKVVRAADGRVRDAIMVLREATVDGELREDLVESVTGVVDEAVVRDICEEALKGNPDEAMRRLDVDLFKEGANPSLLVEAFREVIPDLSMPEDSRVKAFEILADVDDRVHRGLNPQVQFHALLGHLYVAQGLSVYSQQDGGDRS
jgi:replication factor C small subunit